MLKAPMKPRDKVHGDTTASSADLFSYPNEISSIARPYISQILGAALCENDTLTSLDLSYNSVTPAAAMVLGFALKVERTKWPRGIPLMGGGA